MRCGQGTEAPVELTDVTLLGPPPDAIAIEGITIDPFRGNRSAWIGSEATGEPAVGTVLVPGRGRYPLVVTVRGVRPGKSTLATFRVGFTFKGEAGSIGFASVTSFRVTRSECNGTP